MNTLPGKKNFGACAIILSALVLLPGCDWFKGKVKKEDEAKVVAVQTQWEAVPDDGSEVLVTMNGKSFITAKMFEREFYDFLEKNQQLKALLAFMPDMEQKFLEGLVNQRIIDRYIVDKAIDQSEEYKRELDECIKACKQMLNARFFTQEHPVEVTDAQVKKFYEENKESQPELIVSRGGIQLQGVQFDKEEAAKKFLEKVKSKPDQLEKIAKDENLGDKFRDFKLVNPQSLGVEPALKDKVLEIKKFPTVELIKVSDDVYWVAAALGKEDQKYRPFEQVKEPLKEAVMKEKQMDVLEDVIGKLKEQYNVDINKEYLKRKEEEQRKERQQQAMASQLEFDAAQLDMDDKVIEPVRTI